MNAKEYFEKLLAKINVKINGPNPWDIQVHDERLFNKMIFEPSLGAGEGYMWGWWDCQQLDELFYRVALHDFDQQVHNKFVDCVSVFVNKIINFQTHKRALKVVETHYNLGNDLYSVMLGPTMAYSCAYWKRAQNLDQAQIDKYELICQKIRLKENDRVLDLGCGWGSLANYMAENYKCKVVGVNISTEQVSYARERINGLPVEICLCDYRDIHQYNPENIPFDKVVSVGSIEHVGRKNLQTFMKIVQKNIKEDGIFLLQSVGNKTSQDYTNRWTAKYIFPNSPLPSLKWLIEAVENRFVVEDVHNFGFDYSKTMMAWNKNFIDNWDKLKGSYDETFRRMWTYYLLSCAGGFRARNLNLYQFVLTPKGMLGGYETVR